MIFCPKGNSDVWESRSMIFGSKGNSDVWESRSMLNVTSTLICMNIYTNERFSRINYTQFIRLTTNERNNWLILSCLAFSSVTSGSRRKIGFSKSKQCGKNR